LGYIVFKERLEWVSAVHSILATDSNNVMGTITMKLNSLEIVTLMGAAILICASIIISLAPVEVSDDFREKKFEVIDVIETKAGKLSVLNLIKSNDTMIGLRLFPGDKELAEIKSLLPTLVTCHISISNNHICYSLTIQGKEFFTLNDSLSNENGIRLTLQILGLVSFVFAVVIIGRKLGGPVAKDH